MWTYMKMMQLAYQKWFPGSESRNKNFLLLGKEIQRGIKPTFNLLIKNSPLVENGFNKYYRLVTNVAKIVTLSTNSKKTLIVLTTKYKVTF